MVKQAQEGRSLAHVAGQLYQMDVRKEVMGPVMEVLTALEQ